MYIICIYPPSTAPCRKRIAAGGLGRSRAEAWMASPNKKQERSKRAVKSDAKQTSVGSGEVGGRTRTRSSRRWSRREASAAWRSRPGGKREVCRGMAGQARQAVGPRECSSGSASAKLRQIRLRADSASATKLEALRPDSPSSRDGKLGVRPAHMLGICTTRSQESNDLETSPSLWETHPAKARTRVESSPQRSPISVQGLGAVI